MTARLIAADRRDQASEYLSAGLDRALANGQDVDETDYDACQTITDEDAERIRTNAIEAIEDVAQAYGRAFVLAVLDGKVTR